MKIISPANTTAITVLGKAKDGTSWRMLHHTAQTQVRDGVLLYNLLTKELVLLTPEEYEHRLESEYLRQRWFVVPEQTNEKELSDTVRWVARMKEKKSPYITSYTIFTTTDCNARCFYCFELGWNRVHMTEETALKAVQYIKEHCGGHRVSLSWFGGEPLYNMGVIDIICDGLRKEGIAFTSAIATNGYLFDKETVEKAVKSWNLVKAQIPMDGTEEVYNKIKAYIYKDGKNPYQVVMDAMGYLAEAGVEVFIRLNMDLYNHADLMKLVDEIAARYADRERLYIYCNHLYKSGVPSADLYTEEEWKQREDAMAALYEKIEHYGMVKKRGIHKHIKLYHCMADNSNTITIAPKGDLGRCEQCNEQEFVGHMDREGFDQQKVAAWKEQIPEIPECATCFCYPECLELKKCATSSVCYAQARVDKLRQTKHRMEFEYEIWKQQEASVRE